MMLSPEEKTWRRLVADLDKHPVDTWQIIGLLGEPDIYPNSLYKLYARPPGSRQWWCGSAGLGRLSVSRMEALEAVPGLPRERVIRGLAPMLRCCAYHPGWEAGLGRLLKELQRRLG